MWIEALWDDYENYDAAPAPERIPFVNTHFWKVWISKGMPRGYDYYDPREEPAPQPSEDFWHEDPSGDPYYSIWKLSARRKMITA